MMDMTGLLLFLLLGQTPVLAALRDFHFVNLLATWAEAQSYCREKFVDLATIENAEEWARVSQIIANSGQADAWIGLYDDVKSWRWSLDNTFLFDQELGSWFPYHFENYNSGEHCADVFQGRIVDDYCGYEMRSVCYDETSNSYIPMADAKDWQSAQNYCKEAYTDLASIRDEQEFNDILSMVDSSANYWVGLFRDSWKWSDPTNSSFNQWNSGQPSGFSEKCGAADVNGWFDTSCDAQRPFICSAPPRRVLKVTLKTDGTVNLNDPLVQAAVLKQMEKDLRGQGLQQEFSLRWRKQTNGDVFNKTEL